MMKMNEIMEIITKMGRSQSFYNGLRKHIVFDLTGPEKTEVTQRLEAQNFKTAMDIVDYFEG